MAGTAETGRLLQTTDWSRTPLGPAAQWPQSLQLAVGICQSSRFPMFVWWGPELVNIYNDAYVPILGKRHPQAFGRPAREIWGEIWPVIGPQAEGVMLRGEATWNERVLLVMERHGYPEDTYFTWSYSPIRDETGGIGGLFCACKEETATVQAERERDLLLQRVESERTRLRESEARFRQLADAMPQIVFTAQADGEVDYFNRQWYDYTGLPAGTAGPESWKAVHTEEGLRRVMEAWPEAIRTGQPYEIEYELRRHDAAYRWHLGRALPIKDEQGRVVRWLGTNTDIHALKRFEQSLQESEGRFRELSDALASEKRVLEMIANGSPLPHVLEAIARAAEDQSADGLLCSIFVLDENGERLLHGAAPSLRACGSEPVIGSDGTVLGTVAMYYREPHEPGAHDRDLSRAATHLAGIVLEKELVDRRLRQSLEAEQAARTEAERASRMKDEFLATLSHELRTPLNAILGWTRILALKPAVSDEIRRGVDVIERNARAQAIIIEDLLDMSAIVSGKVRLTVEPVDLATVVQSAVATVAPAAAAKQITVETRLDARAALVRGDASRLQQVFWNLLSNAVKFTPREGRVTVTLAGVDSHFEVSVRDTGDGIAPEFLPHVFDRFRQADATSTRRHGGLGLGLSIVRQLVELHGGSVQAVSEGLGRGATFTVALPLPGTRTGAGEGPEPPVAGSDSAQAPPADVHGDVAGLRVLVVDDEVDARDMVKQLLEERRAVVTTAGSADEALRLLRQDRYDVLISDIGMPGEDGHSLIQRVRALGPAAGGDLPALALTAYARPEDRTLAMRAGYQVHVVKPVDPAVLFALVAGAARRR